MMYTMVYVLTFVATAYKVYRRWMYCAVRPCEKKTLDSGIYEMSSDMAAMRNISPSELEKLLLDGLKEEIQREIEKNNLKPIDKSI